VLKLARFLSLFGDLEIEVSLNKFILLD